jgi:serine/threonine-protein kinase RsbW
MPAATPQTKAFAALMLSDLSVPARTELVPPVVEFVSGVAQTTGLGTEDCLRLEGAVEEAAANVIQHAFAASDEGHIRVTMERLAGRISVRIYDLGLPADLSDIAKGKGVGIGSKVMHAFADEVRFHNLGHEGKCVELIKNLPYKSVEGYVDQTLPPGVEKAAVPDVEIRFMRPDEAILLSRCIYFAYGYTYGSEYVYYPERTREMIESGLLASCIAISPEGDIVGHCALVFEHPDDRVAESAVAAVLPAFRGQHLFERLKTRLMEAARDGLPTPGRAPRKLYGLYSEAATIHPYTQTVNLKLGCKETGILLGFAPSTMQFKKIEGGTRSIRQSGMMFYVRTTPEPHREVHVPRRHRGIVGEIYEQLGLDRALVDPLAGDDEASSAHVEVRARPEWGQAYISVREGGADLAEQVRAHLQAMRLQRLDCILLDLPLSHPRTALACDAIEALGFFFGGIQVEARPDGDVLRMQYLNNVVPDLEQMTVVSAFGQRLRDYVVKCMPE